MFHYVPFIDTVNTKNRSQNVQNADNNINNVSDTPVIDQPVNLPTTTHYTPEQPVNLPTRTTHSTPDHTIHDVANRLAPLAGPSNSTRPSRTHKLPTYLHDYIMPKNITKPPP